MWTLFLCACEHVRKEGGVTPVERKIEAWRIVLDGDR